jgi:hypothetical protein
MVSHHSPFENCNLMGVSHFSHRPNHIKLVSYIYTVYIYVYTYISHRDIPIKSIPSWLVIPWKIPILSNPHCQVPDLPPQAVPTSAPEVQAQQAGNEPLERLGDMRHCWGGDIDVIIVFVDIRTFPKSWGYPQTIQVIACYQWEQLWFGVPTIWKECRIRSIIVLSYKIIYGDILYD